MRASNMQLVPHGKRLIRSGAEDYLTLHPETGLEVLKMQCSTQNEQSPLIDNFPVCCGMGTPCKHRIHIRAGFPMAKTRHPHEGLQKCFLLFTSGDFANARPQT